MKTIFIFAAVILLAEARESSGILEKLRGNGLEGELSVKICRIDCITFPIKCNYFTFQVSI